VPRTRLLEIERFAVCLGFHSDGREQRAMLAAVDRRQGQLNLEALDPLEAGVLRNVSCGNRGPFHILSLRGAHRIALFNRALLEPSPRERRAA
jgi:hypothetical protein